MRSRNLADRSVPRQRELPTFYYHQHFLELLEFVSTHYEHVLSREDSELVTDFGRLDTTAQRLYVRLVNRKGRIFAIDKLRYPELGPLSRPLAALRRGGWVGSPGSDLFRDVLGFLTKTEIQDCLSAVLPGVSRSLTKNDLVQLAFTHCDPADFMAHSDPERLLVQRRSDWVRFLLFLYFGECREGLSRFTLRDMGLVQTHSFRESFEPRFADREEAVETYYFASRLQQFRDAGKQVRRGLMNDLEDWPEPEFGLAADLRDKLAHAMGRELEKAGRTDTALQVYSRGDSPACRERLVRVLLTDGDRELARSHLEDCLQNPRSDEEFLFARDLYRRKFGRKRTSPLTDALRTAEIIEIDEGHSGSPERAAIRYFEGLGHRAFRSENTLWRSLFGLMFWDELFSPESAALHSPFEALPSSLNDGSFYGAHRRPIETKLQMLDDPAATKRQLLKTITRYFGTANGLFRWRRSTAETMFALIEHADAGSVASVLRHMCQNYRHGRYGFPDLLVIDNSGVRFVEIKTEGDQIRRNQMLRLEQLREAGFRADVVRVRWILDPAQVYVVVDVETTGGTGDQHRITELAAVKVRGEEIVERYQTLVNPQRPIPAGITRLTGITDAMVADAPVFADIADDYAEFMEDAIFVAHNVNFDYGFVSREYARLGRSFRHPKLCTCASMRRLYPGLSSYSLGALCNEFQIPLKQHHRALCDAEAAAELLFLVNEKRAESLAAGS